MNRDMKTYRNFIFDMDGTLFTSEPILGLAYADAVDTLEKENIPGLRKPAVEEILKYVGYPASVIFANLFPHADEETRSRLNAAALEALVNRIGHAQDLMYPGTKEFLEKIHRQGIRMYLASNGRRKYLAAILEAYKLTDFFPEFFTIEDPQTPSKSAILEYYIRKNNLAIEQTVMVGDRKSDLDAARDNGIDFIGVLWGHGNKQEIASADYLFDTVEDFARAVLG